MNRDGNRFSLVPSVSDMALIKLEAEKEQFRQAWKARLEEAAILRAALEQCAAPYVSPPCTVQDGYAYLEIEFGRRMTLAAEVLHDIAFPENELTDA